MANTTNLNLVKPGLDDAALITQINSNMDLIDAYAGDTTGAMKKMCPVITGNTNNSGYTISSGEFFVANKKLYKATASIATNASWSSSATELSDHGAVNAAYSALNSNLATKTYNWSGSNVGLTRIGNTVMFNGLVGSDWNNESAGSQLKVTLSNVLTTVAIPSGYRPARPVDFQDNYGNKRLTVDTNGEFAAVDKLSGVILRFSACWVTTDAMP